MKYRIYLGNGDLTNPRYRAGERVTAAHGRGKIEENKAKRIEWKDCSTSKP